MARDARQETPQALAELRATPVWSKLKAALRRLPGLHGDVATEPRLCIACDRLAPLAGLTASSDTPFRLASRKTTRTELDELARLADALADHVERDLHMPAIIALADAHVMRDTVRSLSREWAMHARRADLSQIPERIGRGQEQLRQLARAVGWMLRQDVEALTGKRPTITVRDGEATGPFLDLVTEVFSILAIKASPEAVAREALKKNVAFGGGTIRFNARGEASPHMAPRYGEKGRKKRR
jgi:hypothetical protein